jgi:hypothetical protein
VDDPSVPRDPAQLSFPFAADEPIVVQIRHRNGTRRPSLSPDGDVSPEERQALVAAFDQLYARQHTRWCRRGAACPYAPYSEKSRERCCPSIPAPIWNPLFVRHPHLAKHYLAPLAVAKTGHMFVYADFVCAFTASEFLLLMPPSPESAGRPTHQGRYPKDDDRTSRGWEMAFGGGLGPRQPGYHHPPGNSTGDDRELAELR